MNKKEDYDFDITKDVKLINYKIDPKSGDIKFPPLVSEEEKFVIDKFFLEHPELTHKESPHELAMGNASRGFPMQYEVGSEEFFPEEAWIQTFSGKRFTPINPNFESIVIQDIAHSLSMQCRFSGHVKKFYSVAQHCVLVSYLCNMEDSLWGLLHDATEAYLVDIPRPLKRSGKFDAYLDFEKRMQTAICARFGLEDKEPPSVKKADMLMLATEARDLKSPLRADWVWPVKPLPLKIEPLLPEDAESLFLNRFYDLIDK